MRRNKIVMRIVFVLGFAGGLTLASQQSLPLWVRGIGVAMLTAIVLIATDIILKND